MKKCLNCGKEVTNKYCGVTCQNEHKRTINEANYNLDPKLCAFCNKPLPYDKRRNKFCGHSCSAKMGNKGLVKNPKGVNGITRSILNNVPDEDFVKCVKSSSTWVELGNKLGYKGRISSNVQKNILKRVQKLEKSFDLAGNFITTPKELIKDQTKDKIFELSKNWQAGRTAIRKNACKVFKESGKEYKCLECGYDKHVEIAHIKAVSEFDGDCYMEEINHIDNLMALCPNHHWEYDNGILKL